MGIGMGPAASQGAEPVPGKQVPASLALKEIDGRPPTNAEIRFQLFVPQSFHPDGQQWPLMLFLHGAGERGTNLDLVKVHGPPKIVDTKPDFPFVLASPQCPFNQRWSTAELIQLVDHLSATFRVDKLYVTGLSMGGYGTWALCAAYPDKFAAAVPICGGGNVNDAGKLKTIPLWVFHGAKDGVVKPEQSEAMVKAVQSAGGNVKYTLYPDAAHDSWTATYANQAVYDWFVSHPRK